MNESLCIGNYIILQTIGSGGFGKVKLAEHKETHQKFAIKIFKKSKLNSKPDLITKIQREVSLMTIFDHPHIIKLYEVFQSTRHLFIVLEYAPNGELFDYLISMNCFPIEEAMRLFRQIIYGVDFLHSHSICHRDLKPENILLDENNNVKIGDFGFARWLKTGTADTSCGSPHYAAPEVVKGIPYNGKKADIWSCGVILFALLSGRLPFNEPVFKDLISKIKHGDYVMPDLPENVKDLIAHMLTVDPEKRYNIEQVKHHKAFRIGLPRYFTPPLPFPLPKLDEATEKAGMPKDVLDTLKQIGFTDEELQEELSTKESTPAKSFWAILTQKPSYETLPWSSVESPPSSPSSYKDPTFSADENKMVHSPFKEIPDDLIKDPFFRRRIDISNGSIDSPIASITENVSLMPDKIAPYSISTEEVSFSIKTQAEIAAAEIQKVFTYHGVDWLFPDDMTIFARAKDVYLMVNIENHDKDGCQITIGFLSGKPDIFSLYVDIVCNALGVHRTCVSTF